MVVCMGGNICVEMITHTCTLVMPGLFHQKEMTKSDHSSSGAKNSRRDSLPAQAQHAIGSGMDPLSDHPHEHIQLEKKIVK